MKTFYDGEKTQIELLELKDIEYGGDNTNGYYIKYPSGVLECWGVGSLKNPTKTAFLGGYKTPVIDIVYPIKFVQIPCVVASCTSYGLGTIYYSSTYNLGTFSFMIFDQSQSDYQHTYSWRAIGRWK